MQFLFVQFCFNVMLHTQSVAALTFWRRLAESDVPVMLSVMYMNWVCWWLAFLSNMNNKHKSISPSTIQVNTQRKTICTDEKLDVISQLEKGKWNDDICHNVWLPHSSICTIHDRAERIAESAKSGTKVFLCAARLPQSYWNKLYQKLWMWVSYIFLAYSLTHSVK